MGNPRQGSFVRPAAGLSQRHGRAGSADTYDTEVRSNPAVQEAVAVLNGCLRTSEAKALLFQGPFQRFSQLWASDLPAALQARPPLFNTLPNKLRTSSHLPGHVGMKVGLCCRLRCGCEHGQVLPYACRSS